MTDTIEASVDGLESLLGKLDELDFDMKRKGGRAALRRAANIIRDSAQQKARLINDPNTPESIAANIAVRWNNRRFKRNGDLAFRVGVLGGAKQYGNTKANRRQGRVGDTYVTSGSKKNPGGDTWYWRFIELGTRRQRARPFLRPAMTENVQAATDEFIRSWEKSVDRALRRAKKKAIAA